MGVVKLQFLIFHEGVVVMKKQEQPENMQYQILDPKEYADRVVKDALRKSILKLIREYVILIATGIGFGILIVKLQKRFNLDTGMITGIAIIIYVLLILFAGYCLYRYLKAVGEDE